MMSVLHFICQSALGFLIGTLSKFLVFPAESNSWLIFALLGTVGAAFGSKTARQLFGVNNIYAGWGLAAFGAIIVLIAYRFIAQ